MQAVQIDNREFWIDFLRAMAGALIFSLPLLMTMEMWWLGMYLERYRMALLVVLLLPILIGLSRYSGFKPTMNWYDDTLDALVAFAAGLATAGLFLSVFAILQVGMSFDEIIGKVTMLAVPASMGAVIASKQMGTTESENEKEKERAGYGGELFIMLAGALFLAFNVAPTEEMVLIAYKMTSWHAVALVILTVLVMHGFVYAVGFRGEHRKAEHDTAAMLDLMFRFTIVGYVLAFAASAYTLWTFGRMDGISLESGLKAAVVLASPAGFGAALARLVI